MSARPVPRRAYAARLSPSERREQILDAALELTRSCPVSALTMESIAEAAEVTKPVVYGVFPNADAVVEALFEREQDRGFQYALDALPTQDEPLDDPVTVAFEGMKAFQASVRAHPATWRLLLAADALPETARLRHEEVQNQILAIFVSLCEWASSERPSGPVDPELYARLLMSGLEMAALRVIEDPDLYPEERVLGFAAEVLRALQNG